MQSKKWLSAAALIGVVGVSGLTAGCSQGGDSSDSGTDAAATAPGATPILTTEAWGVVDGMLSVVVSNTSDRTLRYAEGVVNAVDADGRAVTSSLDHDDAGCCAVVDLRPGEQYGLYLDVGPSLDRVDDVTVDFRNISWVAASAAPSPDEVTATSQGVEDGTAGAVVEATLTTPKAVDQIGVQAFLTDADGKFLAVVSGRWTCLEPGKNRIHMQLFHPVPAGTEVESMAVHAVDGVAGASASAAPVCDDSGKR